MGTNQFQAIFVCPLRSMVRNRFSVIAVFAALASGQLSAQTNNSYPMLMSLKPTAAQIGQGTEHELNARYNLAGSSQVLVSGDGVIGEVILVCPRRE